MTLDEVRQAAGLANASTLRRAIAAGRLRARKVGTTWIVDRDEALRWIAERRRGRPRREERPQTGD